MVMWTSDVFTKERGTLMGELFAGFSFVNASLWTVVQGCVSTAVVVGPMETSLLDSWKISAFKKTNNKFLL